MISGNCSSSDFTVKYSVFPTPGFARLKNSVAVSSYLTIPGSRKGSICLFSYIRQTRALRGDNSLAFSFV